MVTKSSKANPKTSIGKPKKKQSSTKPGIEVKTKVIITDDDNGNNNKSSEKSKKPKATNSKDTSASKAKTSSKNNSGKSTSKFKKPKILKIFKGKSPFRGYFVGSWKEIRQVKWPDRKTSWKLTFSVLVFSVAFSAFLAGLDLAFEKLSKLIFMR